LTLRFRFILSTVLPIFIVLPLMGLLSVYMFEQRILIPRQSREIESDMDLFQDLARENPSIFTSTGEARTFIDSYARRASWRLMIIDPDGFLMAISDPDEQSRVGETILRPEFEDVLSGQELTLTEHSPSLDVETIDTWAAVHDRSGNLLGVLRISLPLETITDELMRLRGLIALTMGAGLLVGTLIALGLATSMERPLTQMTESISAMAWKKDPEVIHMEGPEEFKLLASAFNHLIERIDEMEVTRRKLLANLVHELGRPLGALSAALHALMSGADQDPELQLELLVGMDTQTRDLARLVDDLTHLYDEDAGRFKLESETVEIQTWLRETVATWRAQANQKSIHLILDAAQEEVALNIDPHRMSQALGNLLSNAIKFTPTGGEIRVRAGVEDQQMVIRVQDSGPGLSPEDRENLFTPFYRGKHSTRFPKGMGLGLSIARDILQSHGGKLVLEESKGPGTKFAIHLPLDARPDQSA
jgi:signal transduction histidine kinase